MSRKKILEMFDKYAGGKDTMGPEEVMQFCSDLAVDPEDVNILNLNDNFSKNLISLLFKISVLILCWHFKAELSCYFKKEEFVNGCTELK